MSSWWFRLYVAALGLVELPNVFRLLVAGASISDVIPIYPRALSNRPGSDDLAELYGTILALASATRLTYAFFQFHDVGFWRFMVVVHALEWPFMWRSYFRHVYPRRSTIAVPMRVGIEVVMALVALNPIVMWCFGRPRGDGVAKKTPQSTAMAHDVR